MKTTKTPISKCECGAELDAASNPGATPKPGDISFCLYCGSLKEFDSSMQLIPTDEEALHPSTKKEIEKAREFVKKKTN